MAPLKLSGELLMRGTQPRPLLWGTLALVLASALWALTFPAYKLIDGLLKQKLQATQPPEIVRLALEHPWHFAATYLAVRFTLAALLLAVVRPRLLPKLRSASTFPAMLTGLAFFAGAMLQTVGLQQIDSSRSAFLTSLYVVFTPMLAGLMGWEKPRRLLWVAVILALLGMVILTDVNPWKTGNFAWNSLSILTGDWLTIASAVLFAVQILLVDHFASDAAPDQFSLGVFLAVAVGGWCAVGFASAGWLGPGPLISYLQSGYLWIVVLLVSVFCTLGPFYLMNRYQSRVGPTQASVIYATEPIFTALAVILLPPLVNQYLPIPIEPDRFSATLIIGGSLLLIANALAAFAGSARST